MLLQQPRLCSTSSQLKLSLTCENKTTATVVPNRRLLFTERLYGSVSLPGTVRSISKQQHLRRSVTVAAEQQRDSSSSRPNIFPAGKRQSRVDLPALFITISASDVVSSKNIRDDIESAITGGATAIVLKDSSAGGAAQLYEAAVLLKDLIRGRTSLLISDRTDIVDAAGADGALLSPNALPTVVAKKMLQNGLALVGRSVQTPSDAVQAAAEGCNFVVLESPSGAEPSASSVSEARQQKSGSSVPLIALLSGTTSHAALEQLLGSNIDGVCLDISALTPVAAALTETPHNSLAEAAAAVLQRLSSGSTAQQEASSADSSSDGAGSSAEKQQQQQQQQQPKITQLSQMLSANREQVVAEERQALSQLLAFLEEKCPKMDEVSLLRDALKQLDELFLLVVVGEFNSGKSAVINALLGQRYLAEGILPTTNEISVLKFAENEKGEEYTTQDSDGLYIRHLPVDLLREVNVVDTPGTNVILERQQRLTEEYVPRADLVLFVMSADRPFTDSEVGFLKYIRQWGKKVVFVVNKVDMLTSGKEVEEVVQFVRQNAQRLLGVEGAQVLPVSARAALDAKLDCRSPSSASSLGNVLSLEETAALTADVRWQRSRFESLEQFIYEFLLGVPPLTASNGSNGDQEVSTSSSSSQQQSSIAGAESVRLKLQTPLFVADALLEAARIQLEKDLEVAREDVASIKLVRQQLAAFKKEMIREGSIQRDEVAKLVAVATDKAAAVVDSTLQLSNWSMLSTYLFGQSGLGSSQLPVARRLREAGSTETAAGEVKGLIREHSRWVSTNCKRQRDNYRSFATTRAAALNWTLEALQNAELEGLENSEELRRRWRQLRMATPFSQDEGPSSTSLMEGQPEDAALVAVNALDPRTTEVLLEEEVREAVLSTAGTAAGAGAFGVVLTTVLPNTLEDLLALGISAMVGYVSILNLPLRRAEAKRKLEATTSAFVKDIQEKMETELMAALEACETEVLTWIEPLEHLAAKEVSKSEDSLQQREALAGDIERLQKKAANVN